MASFFSTTRGYLSLAVACVFVVIADPIQRTIIALSIRLFPNRKQALSRAWLSFLAKMVLWPCRVIGGAKFLPFPHIPSDKNTLVLMNHQSLLDIPVTFRCMYPNYARLVTRQNYRRNIPLISHLLKLFDFPSVDPVRFSKRQLEMLNDTAAHSETPIGIFPEGTRTKNGEIGRFRTAGSAAILSSRPWTVYLLLIDGLWRCGKIGDFAREISHVRVSYSVVGPLQFDPENDDPEAFLSRARETMIEELARLRATE